MTVPGIPTSSPGGFRTPIKKRGRIPRRWVFLDEDGRAFAFIKVTRITIREVELVAQAKGWEFEEAVLNLIRLGLRSLNKQLGIKYPHHQDRSSDPAVDDQS